MINPENERRASVVCVLLALFTFVTYWPALKFDFVNYDDPYYVIRNLNIQRGLSAQSLQWAFTTGHAGNWHPLTWVSHIIDVNLFGLKPAGHHLTNILLHTLNAVLVFLMFRKMTGTLWRSALVAALFALHPLHVESVAWIAERKDVLSTFFWALTILAYLFYVEKPALTRYLMIIVLFALGLMAKPMVVTLPLLLLLLDFWPLGRIANPRTVWGIQLAATPGREGKSPLPRLSLTQLILEKVPLFVLTAMACAVTLWAQRRTVMPLHWLPFLFRFCNAVYSYSRYIWRMVWPENLIVHYPYPQVWSIWFVLMLAVAIAVISWLAIKLGQKRSYLITGWLWFLGTLVPTIGLVQVGTQAMADRYTYVPLIGLFMIVAWGGYEFLSSLRFKPALITAAAVVIIASCVAVTRVQLQYWQNSVRLWQHAVDVIPDNALAYFNLAVGLLDKGDLQGARGSFEKATKINPAYAEAWNNIAYILTQMGQPEEAVKYYQEALKHRPNYGLAHYDLGLAFAEQGRFDDAVRHFQQAMQCGVEIRTLHKDMGHVLTRQGKFEQAVAHLREYVRLQPGDIDGYIRLGEALRQSGADAEARQCYYTALTLQPKLPEQYERMAQNFADAGKFEAAVDRYSLLLQFNGDNPVVRERFGMLLAGHNRVADAITNFTELLRLRPDAQSHYNLALAFVMQKDVKAAIDHYRAALKLQPEWPLALNDLAWILATYPEDGVRNGTEAIRLAERACELTKPDQARFWGTRDAAYAEAGRFEDAIKAAEQTRQLAAASGETNLVAAAEQRLELYRRQQAFRQN